MVEDATGIMVEDASLVNKQCGVAQDTTCNKVSKIKVVVTMAGVTVATFTDEAKNTYENTFRVKHGLEDREKNLVKLTVEDVAASRRRRAQGTVRRGRRSLLADGVKITTDLTIKHQAAAGAPAGATPEEVAQQMEAKVAKIAQDIDKGMADGSFAEDLKKAAVEAQIEVLAADTVQVAAVTKAVDNIQKVVETQVIVEAPKPVVPVNPGGASNQVKTDKPDDTASEGGAPIGPIVGGVLGALAIVAVIVFVYKRKTGQGGGSNANGSRHRAGEKGARVEDTTRQTSGAATGGLTRGFLTAADKTELTNDEVQDVHSTRRASGASGASEAAAGAVAKGATAGGEGPTDMVPGIMNDLEVEAVELELDAVDAGDVDGELVVSGTIDMVPGIMDDLEVEAVELELDAVDAGDVGGELVVSGAISSDNVVNTANRGFTPNSLATIDVATGEGKHDDDDDTRPDGDDGGVVGALLQPQTAEEVAKQPQQWALALVDPAEVVVDAEEFV